MRKIPIPYNYDYPDARRQARSALFMELICLDGARIHLRFGAMDDGPHIGRPLCASRGLANKTLTVKLKKPSLSGPVPAKIKSPANLSVQGEVHFFRESGRDVFEYTRSMLARNMVEVPWHGKKEARPMEGECARFKLEETLEFLNRVIWFVARGFERRLNESDAEKFGARFHCCVAVFV